VFDRINRIYWIKIFKGQSPPLAVFLAGSFPMYIGTRNDRGVMVFIFSYIRDS